MKIPDAITPVVGYRGWSVGMGRLWSPRGPARVPWPMRGPLRARCLKDGAPNPFHPEIKPAERHDAPQPDCSCGVYAAREPWDIEASWVTPPWRVVWGKVHGWGRVVLGRTGWRAELVRPVELFADPSWNAATRYQMNAVAKTYGLPLLWEENVTLAYPDWIPA
jgi:hypothetical protein